MLRKSISVRASVKTVWEAIISYRTADGSRRKVISVAEEGTVIEETFGGLPVVGQSRVVYTEIEQPFEQISYSMVESDKLSRFEGCWIITESGNGMVSVELSTFLDSHLPIPFKENLLRSQASKDMDVRLGYVKKKAESRD